MSTETVETTKTPEMPPEVVALVDAAMAAIREHVRKATRMSVLPGGGMWIHRRGWGLAKVRGYAGHHTDGALEILDNVFGKEESARMAEIRRTALKGGITLVEDDRDYTGAKEITDEDIEGARHRNNGINVGR